MLKSAPADFADQQSPHEAEQDILFPSPSNIGQHAVLPPMHMQDTPQTDCAVIEDNSKATPIPIHHKNDSQICIQSLRSTPSLIPKQNHPHSSPLPASPRFVSQFAVGSVDDGSNLPPPTQSVLRKLHFHPPLHLAKSLSEPGLSILSHVRTGSGYVADSESCTAIDEEAECGSDLGVGAGSVTNTDAPFDPNLQCICCGQKFRKGEIQIFRQHVLQCTR